MLCGLPIIPNGMEVTYEQDGETVSEVIPAEILTDLLVHTRVDVSRASAFDKYAREQSLENAFSTTTYHV